MSVAAALALALGVALDALVGEPSTRFHPVAWFGRAVGRADRPWRHPRLAGALVAFALPLAAAAVVAASVALPSLLVAGPAALAAGAAVAGLWVFVASSRRALVSTAADVLATLADDPDAARDDVRALVGRDTDSLSVADLRSAAVESAAENLADGLVAPLTAFALGAQVSLPVAAAAAAWVKAVNTLDSMLGYPSKPHGTASARLDDAVMWLPARVSAFLLAVAGGDIGALHRAAAWARDPPSPNSGWPMATLAAVLDVRLAKPGVYALHPTADPPTPERARRGVRIVDRAAVLGVALTGVCAWV
ncbi:adenosylcobinamide-phosphate synthase [Halarchaeum rubridurum]|uniref:Probable cobalamin biosynthesis protein CobD n=1 Tax=Halarchaeum rubridurum TaxID=489911 RepID=A0A830FYS6_9EURY|nr:adenosylcobinamide-phosphate synthase CbiB [Halarchaeum rubridurum]MBP1954494.1 adenosylcobinamide-phosphate synthase [Halarchaeum rubridurum]GGM61492.1 CobD/CbiB family cobalamin biosynthesis protein [Halarchaeum rubridurum]